MSTAALLSEIKSSEPYPLPQLTLKRGEAGPSLGRHPWIYAPMLEKLSQEIPNGETVSVVTHDGRFVGYGLFNAKSHIRCRLYSFREDAPLNETFWKSRIASAIELRRKVLPNLSTGRLVFSEGDGLSGLVVDSYAGHLILQITSLGIYQRRDLIVEALRDLLSPQSISLRMDGSVLRVEGLEEFQGHFVLSGEVPDAPVTIEESSIQFQISLGAGQKTGFYLDQRDNRKRLIALSKNKRVLDLFTFMGAFALAASKGGATEVIAVDSSASAIEAAKANAALNGATIDFRCEDVFAFLEAAHARGEVFDIVIVDPPKFSPSRGAKEKALQNYFRLNRMALQVLAPQGLLVTCSCSHQIKRQDFKAMLAAVFRKEKRDGRIFFQGSQAEDHPIDLACPETEYLKAFFCEVHRDSQ